MLDNNIIAEDQDAHINEMNGIEIILTSASDVELPERMHLYL